MAGDDMAGNGTGPVFDAMAQYARLSERVENQGKDIIDLRSNMNTGFSNLTGSVNALANEFRANTKTQWPVIWAAAGVCFTILAAAGTFLYSTLAKGQDRLDYAIVKVADNTVTRAEMDWRTERGKEDRSRMEGSIADLRAGLVPRAEHERVWQNYDQRFADQQRQIDEVKQAQSSVYNQRDVIRDILERMDRVEHLKPVTPGS